MDHGSWIPEGKHKNQSTLTHAHTGIFRTHTYITWWRRGYVGPLDPPHWGRRGLQYSRQVRRRKRRQLQQAGAGGGAHRGRGKGDCWGGERGGEALHSTREKGLQCRVEGCVVAGSRGGGGGGAPRELQFVRQLVGVGLEGKGVRCPGLLCVWRGVMMGFGMVECADDGFQSGVLIILLML